jgi:CheY-like chemotaxis protein
MCIDNEPAVTSGMRTLLEGWGCQVLTANSTREALTSFEAGWGRPDVLVVDYHLDEGTGIEAIADVRDYFKSGIPAIVVTADHSPEVERALRELGHGLLRKPVKAGALRALISAHTVRGSLAAE